MIYIYIHICIYIYSLYLPQLCQIVNNSLLVMERAKSYYELELAWLGVDLTSFYYASSRKKNRKLNNNNLSEENGDIEIKSINDKYDKNYIISKT